MVATTADMLDFYTDLGKKQQQGEIKFLSELCYRDFGVKNLWYLTADFHFIYLGVHYCIPAGFVLDFYSIPRALRWMFPNNQGVYNESAAIHDFLVRNRKVLGLSLMECHHAFNAAMDYQDMGSARRRTKFSAVVLFNWMAPGPGDGTPGRRARKAIAAKKPPNGINFSQIGPKSA